MTIDDKLIRDFLLTDKDFFFRHPDILSFIKIPHPDTGKAVSLLEMQNKILRNQLANNKKEQEIEYKIANYNYQALENIFNWIFETFSISRKSSSIRQFLKSIRKSFELEVISFLLKEDVEKTLGRKPLNLEDQIIKRIDLLKSSVIYSDGADFDFWKSKLYAGFSEGSFENGKDCRGLAVLPLRSKNKGESIGVILFGTSDRDRLNNQLGNFFLDILAEVIFSSFKKK